MSGRDTEPGATFFQIVSITLAKVHDPIKIEFNVDMGARKAQLVVDGLITARAESISNAVTDKEDRLRFDLPDGLEYSIGETGRGFATVSGPLRFELADSHAHFASIKVSGAGVIRD